MTDIHRLLELTLQFKVPRCVEWVISRTGNPPGLSALCDMGAFGQVADHIAASVPYENADLDWAIFLATERRDLGLGACSLTAARSYSSDVYLVRELAPAVEGLQINGDCSARFSRFRPKPENYDHSALWYVAHGNPTEAARYAKRALDSLITNSSSRRQSTIDRARFLARLTQGYELPSGLTLSKRKGFFGTLPALSQDPNPAAFSTAFTLLGSFEHLEATTTYLSREPSPEELAKCFDPLKMAMALPLEYAEPLKDSPLAIASLVKRGIKNINPVALPLAFAPHPKRPTLTSPLTAEAMTNAWITRMRAKYEKVARRELVWNALIAVDLPDVEKRLIGTALTIENSPELVLAFANFPRARNFFEGALDHIAGD